MLKAKIGNTVLLGLEPSNIENLKAGKPMMIKLKELGLPDIVIGITYGENHEAIAKEWELGLDIKMPTIEPVNKKPM